MDGRTVYGSNAALGTIRASRGKKKIIIYIVYVTMDLECAYDL